MSVVYKVLLGLMVIRCAAYMVVMADEEPPKDGENNNVLTNLFNKLKGNLDEDSIKKFMDFTVKALNEGTKTINEHFSDIKSKIGEVKIPGAEDQK